MTKTKFVLTIFADTISGARALAEEEVASFLEVPSDNLSEVVDMEFSVASLDKDDESSKRFKVTVYVALSRNSVLNIGTK